MSDRNTLVRSLHDVGLAAWFGGSLMGATGLNGAASEAQQPEERLRLASAGWAKWAPWQIAAVAAHAVGGIGLIASNRSRLNQQPGAGSLTMVKLILTVAAAGTTVYSGVLGAKVKQHQDEGAEGATDPGAETGDELASAQLQLKVAQWATPALTGIAVVMGAMEGEQQRGVAGLFDLKSRGLVDVVKQARRRAA